MCGSDVWAYAWLALILAEHLQKKQIMVAGHNLMGNVAWNLSVGKNSLRVKISIRCERKVSKIISRAKVNTFLAFGDFLFSS